MSLGRTDSNREIAYIREKNSIIKTYVIQQISLQVLVQLLNVLQYPTGGQLQAT